MHATSLVLSTLVVFVLAVPTPTQKDARQLDALSGLLGGGTATTGAAGGEASGLGATVGGGLDGAEGVLENLGLDGGAGAGAGAGTGGAGAL